MTTSRSRGGSDPGVVAIALVLVAMCVVVAGILSYAGAVASGPCAGSCACQEAPR